MSKTYAKNSFESQVSLLQYFDIDVKETFCVVVILNYWCRKTHLIAAFMKN